MLTDTEKAAFEMLGRVKAMREWYATRNDEMPITKEDIVSSLSTIIENFEGKKA